MTTHRIGLVVPSSNTTMETEVPRLLREHTRRHGEDFTFHASRAALHTVEPEALHAMVGEGERCAREVSDAHVDVLGYACLVALMAEGTRAHESVEPWLAGVTTDNGSPAGVVSSAGALVRTLRELGMRRIAVVAPYAPELTATVLSYLEDYDLQVVASVSLDVTDNQAVGQLDPGDLPGHVDRLDLSDADGIVLSACVQMPSLPALPDVERRFGLPVVTAATATTRELLTALRLPVDVPEGGAALACDNALTATGGAR